MRGPWSVRAGAAHGEAMSWWLADIVMRVEGAVQVNTHLVRAQSAEEAYAKALAIGEDSDGEFVGLASLNAIPEPLEDGAEIAFVERRGFGEAQARALARPREQLAAFRTIAGAAAEIAPAVLGIDHAQIMIAPGEEGAVRAFYVGLLGFEEIAKPERLLVRGGFWLQAGDRQLHVGVEKPGVDRRATRAHVAYEVAGLDGFRARLQAAGVAILDGEPLAGLERFELRDPAGNRVELLERVT